MKKSLIVAVAHNNVIGVKNGMPWQLSGDFKYFKELTMKKPIIMGRKTFDSIGKALPGRFNIVLTGEGSWQAEGTVTATSVEYAIQIGKQMAMVNGVNELMIIGGATIYEQTITDADRLYITEVDTTVEGDAFFPEIDQTIWNKTSVSQDMNENDITYRFVVYDRK